MKNSWREKKKNRQISEDGNKTSDNTRFIYFIFCVYEWLGVKVNNNKISKKSIIKIREKSEDDGEHEVCLTHLILMCSYIGSLQTYLDRSCEIPYLN